MRRVALTGAGTVNALAGDVPGTMAAMREGRSAIGPLDFRDAERLTIRIGAQIRRDAAPLPPGSPRPALLDPVTHQALVAAAEAVAQAGLRPGGVEAHRLGVILGTAGGGVQTWEDSFRTVFEEGRNRVPPLVVPRLMPNAAAAQIAIAHGARGPCYTVSTACASANHAMGLAFHTIRAGQADMVITGGADSMLCFGGVKAWEGLRVLSPDGCRPFCATRNGMVLGEGAGIFVFEAWERAAARGAEILAEIAGFGMSSDAADIVLPSREGAARAMRLALEDAGIAAEEIGYVNAHGTGTRANDATEAAALRAVFGAALGGVPVSATKSLHGHAIGGAGAIELIACLMALREGVIAPTAGVRQPDPDCALNLVVGEAREAAPRAAMSNAFAFGGFNAVLVLRRA
ncbi:beta-ketoacyl-[acyl-carrier-protein] synthase family protein [Albidovulum sp.]